MVLLRSLVSSLTAERISLLSNDGFRLSVVVDTPPGTLTGNVVLCHGLQGNKDSTAQYENGFFLNLAKELVQEGYRVLRFDFRGHGESEGQQTDVTLSGEFADLSAAVRYLQRLGAEKVGLVGVSFAGGIVVVYSAQRPERVGALVLVCPTLDYRPGLLENKPFWKGDALREEAVQELKKTGFLPHRDFHMGPVLINEADMIRPFEHMPRIECPVVTIHGDKDSIVPYEMSRRHYRCNDKSELVTLEGAEHGPSILWTPEHTSKTIEATVNWFNKNLVPTR